MEESKKMALQQTTKIGIAGLTLAGALVAVTVRSFAQDPGPNPPPAPRDMPERQMQPNRQPMIGGVGGGITASGDYLYVLQGNRVFKIQSSELKVVKEMTLPGPPRMEMPSGGNRPPTNN